MAPKAKKGTEEGAGSGANGGPPEGFTIKAEKMRGDGWVKKEAGNTIHGRLIGMFYKDSDDGPKPVFYIRIKEPCLCTVGKGEETAEEILEKGAVVNAEGAVFADLERYIGNGGVYDVWFKYKGKEKIKGGRTMWQGDGPYLNELKAPQAGWEQKLLSQAKALKAQAAGKQAGTGDDDIPF